MSKIIHLIPFLNKWFKDKDGDGYGDPNDFALSPTKPDGYVDNGADPDDTNPNIYPGSGGGSNPNNLIFTTTGQAINPLFHGFVMENTWFKTGDSPIVYDIEQDPFFSNINSLKFKIISFPGTQPEHYWVAYENDDDKNVPPTPNGGFNCSACANTNTYCCNPYLPVLPTPVGNVQSCFPKFVDFCASLDEVPYTLIQPNPQDYSTDAYVWTANYLEDHTRGFKGFYLNEFKDKTWLQCTICGNADLVASGCNNIYNAVYDDGFTDINFISDWMWVGATTKTPYSDKYSLTQLNNIDVITGTKAYFAENHLMTQAEIAPGRSAPDYKNSIDTGVDIIYPRIINGIKDVTGLPVASTQTFTITQTGFGNTYLQYYFYARLKLKEALFEALNPGSISLSLFLRGDSINAKSTNMNILGKLVSLFGEFYNDEGVYIHSFKGPLEVYGLGAINIGTNSGKAIVINPNNTSIDDTSITVNNVNKTILSTKWISGTSLSTNCTYGTGGIPAYSITLISF